MKRPLRASLWLVALALVGFGIAIWMAAFRTPAVDRLPLPPQLISLESADGQTLLKDSRYVADLEPLRRHFEGQSRAGFCGVASSVAVLNALQPSNAPVTQATFFNDATGEVRSALRVTLRGMTLAQLAGLLRAHGLEATATFASDTTRDAFRSTAVQNLTASGDYLLVNYERTVLGQAGSGHISPVAAYHEGTDRFLVLDVADYKYPPAWVSAEALWKAMNTIDPDSGRTRGFVVVRGGPSGHSE